MTDIEKKIMALQKEMRALLDNDVKFKLRLDQRLDGIDEAIVRLRRGMPHINFEDRDA